MTGMSIYAKKNQWKSCFLCWQVDLNQQLGNNIQNINLKIWYIKQVQKGKFTSNVRRYQQS